MSSSRSEENSDLFKKQLKQSIKSISMLVLEINQQLDNLIKQETKPDKKILLTQNLNVLTKLHGRLAESVNFEGDVSKDEYLRMKASMGETLVRLGQLQQSIMDVRNMDNKRGLNVNPLFESLVRKEKSIDSKAEDSPLNITIPVQMVSGQSDLSGEMSKTGIIADPRAAELKTHTEQERIEEGLKRCMQDLHRGNYKFNGRSIPDNLKPADDQKEAQMAERKEGIRKFLNESLSPEGAKQFLLHFDQMLLGAQFFFLNNSVRSNLDGNLESNKVAAQFDYNQETNNQLRIRTIGENYTYRNSEGDRLPVFSSNAKVGAELQLTQKGDFGIKLLTNDASVVTLLMKGVPESDKELSAEAKIDNRKAAGPSNS